MEAMKQDEKLNVLFVDDEENVLRALARLFPDENLNVLTATSGADGLEIVKNNEIALVVSDQGMPQMKGTEFLARVMEISPDSVRVILTGYADLNAAVEAINEGGVFQYITKPWDNHNLVLSIRTAVERYRLVKQNRYLTELTNRQFEELKKWNAELEVDIQQQTIDLTRRTQELSEMNLRLKKGFRSFTITISNLIELRDKVVGNHSNNVALIASEIAKNMRLSAEEIETIAAAAQLHDIGKIGMSETALLKDAEEMSPDELQEYRRHPVRGQSALDSNEALREAGGLIRSHHEWFNGEGFPDGLKGEDIPLGARIVAISDRYDRLLRSRPSEAVLDEIRQLRGTQFDPGLYYELEKAVREVRRTALSPEYTREQELPFGELTSGMVLSREVRSGTGILLLFRGAVLNPQKIDSIRRYLKLDPPESKMVYVWARAGNE